MFEKALAGFHKQYPWITVKPIVQPNTVNDTFDPNLINAIKGGNPPDVALPFGPDYVGPVLHERPLAGSRRRT